MRYYYFVSYSYTKADRNGFGYGNLMFDCSFKILTQNEFDIVVAQIMKNLTKGDAGQRENFNPVILNVVLLGTDGDE